ncbi:MAG: FecR domain-containing protein [Cyclobacteriaceae bacterium]
MDHLILKYLRKELSLEERHQLNKWLEEDADRADMLKAFEMYWQSSQYDFSSDKVEILDQIKSRIGQRKDQRTSTFNPSFIRYLKYAAIVILVSSISIISYSTFENQTQVETKTIRHIEKTSLPGQNISLKLPDGSSVKLNAGSKLIVPEIFEGGVREVELVGEAFFNVEPDPSRPFLINVQGMKVEVLGTSFNIKAYDGDTDHLVAVKTGKVKVQSKLTGVEVQLDPQELSILSIGSGAIKKRAFHNEDLIFGWTEKMIVFKDHQVDDVISEIERWFGVEIKLEKTLSKKKLYTARHDNPTIDEVLKSLSFVYEFDFIKKDDNVIVIR